MQQTAKITSIVGGALTLIFGALLTIAMLNEIRFFSPVGIAYILLAVGILSAVGGVLGLIGGIRVGRNLAAARRLMLAAAVCTLPMGFIFFFLFMATRNKLAVQ
jgi:hypothetical protein